ncbi:MAG: (2Fe-2S)-binding protein [Sarcina sp.]
MENVKEEKIICRCIKISEKQIIEAIEKSASTVDEVRLQTMANANGCVSCHFQIEMLIDKYKK